MSLHIEVEGHMTLFEAHDIESAVVESIRAMPEVDDVFVHVDPKELGEWQEDAETNRLVGTAIARGNDGTVTGGDADDGEAYSVVDGDGLTEGGGENSG